MDTNLVSQFLEYFKVHFGLVLFLRLTAKQMGRKLWTMAVVINSETKLTYDDYVLLPDDGKIHEIIDGEHYMTTVPETYHQTLSRRIQFQLHEQIEIICESTGRKDRELKLGLYQKTRVPEHWLADPKSRQLSVYRLKGDSYETVGSFHDQVRFQALEGVTVDLSRVW